jgi:hypothetical protein
VIEYAALVKKLLGVEDLWEGSIHRNALAENRPVAKMRGFPRAA